MSDGLDPFSLPEGMEAEAIRRRTLWLWRFFLGMPFVYLLLAKLIDSVWFDSNRGFGFWPLRSEAYRILLGILGFLAVGAQVVLLLLRSHFNRRIRNERSDPVVAAQLARQRTFYLGACADTVSGLGLFAFLFNGDWNTFIAFCACSYLLYMQAFPGDEASQIEG